MCLLNTEQSATSNKETSCIVSLSHSLIGSYFFVTFLLKHSTALCRGPGLILPEGQLCSQQPECSEKTRGRARSHKLHTSTFEMESRGLLSAATALGLGWWWSGPASQPVAASQGHQQHPRTHRDGWHRGGTGHGSQRAAMERSMAASQALQTQDKTKAAFPRRHVNLQSACKSRVWLAPIPRSDSRMGEQNKLKCFSLHCNSLIVPLLCLGGSVVL